MKIAVCILIVFASIAPALHARALQTATCDTSNIFREILKNQNVMILPQPSFDSPSCGLEWKTFGTCCDTNSLTVAVLRDNDLIRQQQTKVASELSRVEKITALFKDHLAFQQKRTEFMRLDSKNKTLVEALFRIESQLNTDFGTKLAGCWNRMAMLRNASVCFTCTSRSHIFFSNNTFAVMDQNTCLSAVASCQASFTDIARSSEIASKLLNAMDTLIYLTGKTPRHPELTVPVLSQLKNLFCDGSSPLQPCNNVLSTSWTTQTPLWMCKKFLRLRERTLLAEALPLLQFLNSRLEGLGLHVIPENTKTTDTSRTTSGGKTTTISSFTISSTEPVLAYTDPTLTDIDAAYYSTLTEASSDIVVSNNTDTSTNGFSSSLSIAPMNLTLAFP